MSKRPKKREKVNLEAVKVEVKDEEESKPGKIRTSYDIITKKIFNPNSIF